MSRGGIAFCTASVIGCITLPSPNPNSAMNRLVRQNGVTSLTVCSSHMPATIIAVPAIG